MSKYQSVAIAQIAYDKYAIKAGLQPISKQFYFYVDRLKAIVNYSFSQAKELVKLICRCAFNDSSLTDNEAIVISSRPCTRP